MHPLELHLFYVHLEEHSPDTRLFVETCFKFAQKHFKNVRCVITEGSANEYFEDKDFIPHPTLSPCTKDLKIIPIMKYCFANLIDIDLIGYVKTEQRRLKNQQSKLKTDLFLSKEYPIIEESDEWCFDIVLRYIGWYPAIYDIYDIKSRKRVFKHNNCLPCKNMTAKQFESVAECYPDKYARAVEVQNNVSKGHWGRNKGEVSDCSYCKW